MLSLSYSSIVTPMKRNSMSIIWNMPLNIIQYNSLNKPSDAEMCFFNYFEQEYSDKDHSHSSSLNFHF